MAVDKEIKKTIIEHWKNAFPGLTLYAQDKLYEIVGPLIIGLELIKLPRTDEYRPYFVVYGLWKKDLNASLDFPIILTEYYNRKRLQYSLPYQKDNMLFNNVIESIKEQSLLPFDEDISFNKISFVIEEYCKRPPLSAAPNSYLQALQQEAEFKIALYINVGEASKMLEKISKRNWDEKHFKACGVYISEWLQGLYEILSNRDVFLQQIEINKQDKKISRLNSFKLIA